MAITITKAQVKTFENTVRHLSQQKESRVRGWCQEKDITSATHSFKRIAKVALSAKSGSRQATPQIDTAWSNRVCSPSPSDWGDTYESEQAAQMIINPSSELTTAASYAVNRGYDDILIAAATAAALDEDGNSNAFPAGQVVGDYTGEMDMALVSAVAAKFAVNDVDPETPKVALIGPNQARKLMHEPRATNEQYVNMKQLIAGGFIKQWMGFDWVLTNRLLAPSTGQLDCLFFTRQALGLLVVEDMFLRVAEDPASSFLTRVYVKITAGAVRVEDEHIVRLEVLDQATVV